MLTLIVGTAVLLLLADFAWAQQTDPDPRRPALGRIMMGGSTILLALVLPVTGCDSGTEPAAVTGEDTFATNSLAEYDALSRAGTPDVWTLRDGWLVGESDGQAVNARLLRKGVTMADGRVEIETDHLSNGGLNFRVRDVGNYYLLGVRDDSVSRSTMTIRNFELYVYEEGVYRVLFQRDLDIPRRTRFTAAVEFVGPAISLYLNDELIEQVRDSTILGPGQIGVEHDDRLTPGEISRYDVFRWNSLD